MPGEWVLASNNPGKLREIRPLLEDGGIVIRPQRDFGIGPAAETGSSFVENALIKARHAAAHSGLPAIADDSGLCVDALDGAPGIHSSRFAGPGASDGQNVEKLLSMLAGVPDGERGAYFYCAIVVLAADSDPAPLISIGCWQGSIAAAPSGERGFGYDPVFRVPGTGKTAAELAAETKNELSHRGQALAELLRLLSGHRCGARRRP